MRRIAYFESKRFLQHRNPPGHPERPARLESIREHLLATDLWERMDHREPLPAARSSITAVHTPEYVDDLFRVAASGGGSMGDGDTFMSEDSLDVALLAAGASISAVDAVAGGEADAAFCAVRPPGHHAEKDRAMGFCLFNNAAVAARHAQSVHGMHRVAILDWDVHHGNGTQHTFEDDPTVLYISTHQYPFYPGTGSASERGIGAGAGATINIPLPAGTGEQGYVEAFTSVIVPALQAFRPSLLIVSAGFDAHEHDPLGGMRLTSHSYRLLTNLIRDIAPIVSLLEGGYHCGALAESVEMHCRSLEGA